LAIAELDSKEVKQPVRPSVDAVGLLDALPQLKVNLHRAPEELLNRLFDLTQLTVRVHYKTEEATLTVTLPQDNLSTHQRCCRNDHAPDGSRRPDSTR
jgi:site-specific DNA recombinase